MTDSRETNRQLWNEWSEDFQALWNTETADGDLPSTPSPLAPDAPGDPDILDTVEGTEGGGQGAVGTAQLGAETVVGVDLSEEQLAHARKLRALYGVDVQFLQSDVTTAPLADDSFDVAASVAAFQTVEQLDQTLSGTFTALAAGTARAKTWEKGRVSLRSMW